MSTQVVVLGSGYAGAGAVKRLEEELGYDAQLTWVAEHDYHLVLHEVHRCIRDPSVESSIAIPVDEVKSNETEFVKGRATDVDVDERVVELEGGDTVDYDYLLVAIGSSTAFFGIEGLKEFAHQLKGLDDAREIHQDIKQAAKDASRDDPAKVVIGGAGLSGIQTAAEVAEYRDMNRAPIDIQVVEGMDEIFPGNDPELQGALRRRLEELDIEILTGDFISKVDEETVFLGGGEDVEPEELPYDVLVWTGGITGQPEARDLELEQDERSHRFFAEEDFQTSDERVFAVGDCALVEQGPDNVAPPTAQAAWDAADVAGENIARAIAGKPLKRWTFTDKGTVISIGEDAVAHGVKFPVVGEFPVNVFGGPLARMLKKGIAANWISDVTSPKRALSAWNDL
ncbi:NAD(P)/FAD-dependent oxidoreductase [Haloferax mediterranei ATCC 33500]|uniref:NAD(P)/FAD-dependent oxidoreductase n=1 Tax=Haloferax mediterranei (strain ATCC 33500 / DSM 1411 / JCM 8866 / NBRC 14739 / NCIMB 2177 / R-4) TaxID=523841 RepID=I3R533_HALMT|nr:NAD(P)/FAD-dependent oxidoreductase [Haloferax mediterranei]AFK19343.1 NADH dehydrogenase [Haloferax mediterranei ATCC 33500]AHZ21302.1 NADH dehydrogenase [Haloferax mediterranei ATCC 33500]EMA04466.1 NADH dehydrogenase [Haloferax mediterranei ATCC 33500]MDX5989448.1 NAD(P)/FAD-dependent oxidoreductase [Haloferax mediterranei ATCC 33500]QCQ75812.1 NAD(P)/FAD-dependent oxidoreductase [Haloferax mediterranei ATCC 33500]